MNSFEPSSNRPDKPQKHFTIIRIIIIIVLCLILAGILYFGRDKSEGSKNPSESSPETGIESSEPSASAVKPDVKENPPVTVNLDGIDYKIKGTGPEEEAASLEGELKTVAMGKGSMLHISFENQPDSYTVSLFKEDKLVFSGKTPIIFPEDIPANGEYRAVCEAFWTSGGENRTVNYTFNIAADFPPLPFISATETVPGELLVIVVKYVNPEDKIEVKTDLDFQPNIFDYDNKKVIMQPVSYYNKENKVYSLKLIIGEETHSYAINVVEKEFVIQQLTIDTTIAAATRNDESAAEKVIKIDPLKPISDPEPYWKGDFIMPVEGGRVREYDFGKRRHVNGSPSSYRHNGLDIGHDEGVPVMASNNGRVQIADYLIGTGNTIIIEHGLGLKTWYYHMSELKVKTGDMVEKGQMIGLVGSTGFSTGPHLHFSASINGVYINPITLINEGVPLLAIE